MLKIGLTGGIGSGKTMVAKIFSFLDVPVYYADYHAKRLMMENENLRLSIMRLLGESAYKEGHLNSVFIAGKIFNDPELLQQMNALVHPAVHNDFLMWCRNFESHHYVLEEAALIYESGRSDVFDYVIVVDAPEGLRISRVMERDLVDKEEVLRRMKAQILQENKIKRADFIIKNDEERLVTPQVIDLHNKFVSLQTRK